jgi:hypothetical protein
MGIGKLKGFVRSQAVFFSGSAGSGKSTVLGSIVASLNREHGQDCVAVAAPSGIAACNIRGGENQFSAGGCTPIVFGSRHSHCGFAAVTVASFVGAGILSTEECKTICPAHGDDG